jgi:inhibitor of cysteine peptidase
MQQKHISKEVAAAVGDSFTVKLCSNPTTGFQWSESAQISDPTVVQQMKHESLPPETEATEGLVGAPGNEAWTFKALKKGTSTISLEYGRPWEGGEKGEWTFNLTVVVK